MGDGWSVATALLAQERLQLGHPGLALRARERLRRYIAHVRPHLDARLEDLVARAEIEVEVLIASFLAVAEAQDAAGQDSSFLKLLSSETTQFVLDVLQEVAGPEGARSEPLHIDGQRIDLSEMWLQSRRLSIYGGTNEVQRNLVASRTLSLPRGG
jgi:alkylation response protein AidB-like acyl-CoA dehydrogenase